MALQEFFKEVYRRFGIAWALVILLLITSFLLLLCSFGKQSIIPETWIKCGCDDVKSSASREIVSIRDTLIVVKDSMQDVLDKVNKELTRAENELKKLKEQRIEANEANQELLDRIDSLEAVKKKIENEMEDKNDEINMLTDSIAKLLNGGHLDSSARASYNDTIEKLRHGNDSITTRNNVIENVFITSINAKRINDSKVMIQYTLFGINTLKKSGYLDSSFIRIKIYNEKTNSYIRYYPKATYDQNNKSEIIDYSECFIDKDKFVSNDYYEDACYFTNIKDKPFTVGWFGLNPKEFVFQIYLSGFNHPIGYMPRTVKKRK